MTHHFFLPFFYKSVILCLSAAPFYVQAFPQIGVISQAVADLVHTPLGSWKAYKNLLDYKEPSTTHPVCARAHQLLLHEFVRVIDKKGEELLVEIPSLFYTTATNSKKNNRFWTHANNIILLDFLNNNTDLLPPMVSWQSKTKDASCQKASTVVTLLQPFFEPLSRQLLSAGTRFVVSKPTADNNQSYTVYMLHAAAKKCITIHIPQERCLPWVSEERSSQAKRKLFVHVLKKWATSPQVKIPYVWGGTSYGSPANNQKVAPLYGFDCTGLILRAAQACDIPYYFKNSFTITQFLNPIKAYNCLQEGDIIWINGHCMVISDRAANKLIEARGYEGGFGVVHEITLNKVFAGITTYKQLYDTYKNQQPIVRLNKDGSLEKNTRSLMLFSLL